MIRYNVGSNSFNKDFGTVLSRAKNPTGMLKASGRELGNLLKRHFREKDRSNKNKLGGRRQHLWLQIAGSVQNPVQTGFNSVSVSINHPTIGQKVFGGPIIAKRAKNLTIPQTDEAYGRTAATFEHETGRKLIFLKQNDNLLLASKIGQSSRLQVEYVLTPRVIQRPDPTALPTKQQMEDAVISRGRKYLESEAAKEGNQP